MSDYIFYLVLVLSVVLQNMLIHLFQRYQLFQPIYTLSPDSHQQKKWVPSFGGLGIITAIVIGVMAYGKPSPTIAWCMISTLVFALIGVADDFKSLTKKVNKGLSVTEKLVLQGVVSAALVLTLHLFITPLHSIWQGVFYVIIFVGATNATNLTDGLDGLLSTLTIISLLGMAIFLEQAHVLPFYWPLIKVTIAALLGFLVVNWSPAKIFMGDTGSLALGALMTSIAMTINVMMVMWVGAIYIIEALSVIIQVTWYKKTSKRVFLMSPLHHHFELLGLTEVQIVSLFAAIQALVIGVVLCLQ